MTEKFIEAHFSCNHFRAIECILMILFFGSVTADPTTSPVVLTKFGLIIGTSEFYSNCEVETYLGVPYALPPQNDLRFQRPKPMKVWTKPVIATQQPPACYQFSTSPFPWYDNMTGHSEDCLYMNIWVPFCSGARFEKRAVMYWIYGGGFNLGSIRTVPYDGKALAVTGNVIVVTVNYRVGPMGFLFSGSEDAPGNMGLYDILEGLKWVHGNIQAFGGDKNSITIMGESVGSLMVGLLTLSPLTKGLYRRAIMESESPVFTMKQTREINLQHTQILADALNCTNKDVTVQNHPKKIVDCLKKINAHDLVRISESVVPHTPATFSAQFGDALVPKEPTEAVRSGRFHDSDLLLGNNGDEGSLFITAGNAELFGFFGENDPVINKTLGSMILKNFLSDYPRADTIVDFYLRDVGEYDSREIVQRVFEGFGDAFFLCPQVFFAEEFANNGNNVYYYSFTHRPSNSPYEPYLGTTHFSEVEFVFGRPAIEPNLYHPREKILSKRMMKLWTHFANYGNPESSWPLYSSEDPTFKVLDTTSNALGEGPHRKNCDFLKSYYTQ